MLGAVDSLKWAFLWGHTLWPNYTRLFFCQKLLECLQVLLCSLAEKPYSHWIIKRGSFIKIGGLCNWIFALV